jgi:hypothetical protein
VRTLTQGNTHLPLAVLLHRLNQVLRGWTTYFRHAASAKTFACLGAFTWRRVWLWLRHKHRRSSWKELRRLYAPSGVPAQGKASLFNPATVSIIRYRYRGADIPSPWTWPDREAAACPVAGTRGEPDARPTGTSGSEGGPGKRNGREAVTAPRPDPTITCLRTWCRCSC